MNSRADEGWLPVCVQGSRDAANDRLSVAGEGTQGGGGRVPSRWNPLETVWQESLNIPSSASEDQTGQRRTVNGWEW